MDVVELVDPPMRISSFGVTTRPFPPTYSFALPP
jgi:hypothetical protein